MPRYLVERCFPDGFELSHGSEALERLASIVACNSDRRVTWVQSFVSRDKRTVYCVYDAPGPEAIRLSARSSGLPVDRIVEVSSLDPYPFLTY